jgi:Lar family restriction alleviation protein
MSEDIKTLAACPFCGSDQVYPESTCPEDHFIFCHNCECEGPLHMTQEQAVTAWNQRAVLSASASDKKDAELLRSLMDENNPVDTIYFDDGEIIDVGWKFKGDLRAAIAANAGKTKDGGS